MDATNLDGMDEDAIFQAEYRAEHLPSRRAVALRSKLKPSGKEKLASSSRYEHRSASRVTSKNVQRRQK